jgi:hypothetical protein
VKHPSHSRCPIGVVVGYPISVGLSEQAWKIVELLMSGAVLPLIWWVVAQRKERIKSFEQVVTGVAVIGEQVSGVKDDVRDVKSDVRDVKLALDRHIEGSNARDRQVDDHLRDHDVKIGVIQAQLNPSLGKE